jgi:prevent-host-death family protein
MFVHVTVHAAKTNLSRLIAAAEAGEEVVIMRGSVPAVRLVPVGAEAPVRRFGSLAGRVALDEAFFEPLPPAELDAWEG